MKLFWIALLVLPHLALASLTPQAISRLPAKKYVSEGIFQGGQPVDANVEAIRLAQHGAYERWVIDFSDVETRSVGKVAPEFVVKYQKTRGQPRLQILLRKIHRNYVLKSQLPKLVNQSDLVSQILFYPSIEDGDGAIELILKENVSVQFEVHQPEIKTGRLVIDLTTNP